MRTILSIALTLCAAAALAAGGGDTRGTIVDMPAQESVDGTSDMPRRAMTKSEVERRFGEPRSRHAPVGEPPITRWDYAEFSVFFEHDRVLHSVVPGEFPEIDHREELQR